MKSKNILELLDTRIEELPFITRVKNALKLENIDKIRDLVKLGKNDIKNITRFSGHTAADDIEIFLNRNGLYFGMDVDKIDTYDFVNNAPCDIITNLINRKIDISITIKLDDLLQFANHLIRSVKDEFERNSIEEDKLLNATEVSRKLRINISTLWRWNKSGYLVPIEIGGKRLYKKSDIDKILNNHGCQ